MSVDSLAVDWKAEFDKLKLKYESNRLLLYQIQSASATELGVLLGEERKKVKQLTVQVMRKENRKNEVVVPPRSSAIVSDEHEYKQKYLVASNELQQCRIELAAKKPVVAEISKPPKAVVVANTTNPPVIVVDNRKVHELEIQIAEQKKEIEELHRTRLAVKSRCNVVESLLVERRRDIELLLEKNELNNEIIQGLRAAKPLH